MPTSKEILEKYTSWNNRIQQQFNELHPEMKYCIWDGVISPEHYYQSPLKVLFINREAYDVGQEEYDLVETIKKQIDEGIAFFARQNTLKGSLRKELAVIRMMVQCRENWRDIDTLLNEYDKECFEDDFYTCAYINVKKSDGQPKSSVSDLAGHATINNSILEEQIRFFNPSIIVGGNVVDGILENQPYKWGDNLTKQSRSVNVYKLLIDNKEYPYLDLYHPSSTKIDASDIFTAMAEVEENFPGYWKSRLHQECFDLQ